MTLYSLSFLINNPSRFVFRWIYNHEEMKLKNALMEAFIEYAYQKSSRQKSLTEKQARFLVRSLGIPKRRPEDIVAMLYKYKFLMI